MGQFNYTTFMLILLMFLLSHYIKLDLFIDLNQCICVSAYQLIDQRYRHLNLYEASTYSSEVCFSYPPSGSWPLPTPTPTLATSATTILKNPHPYMYMSSLECRKLYWYAHYYWLLHYYIYIILVQLVSGKKVLNIFA